MSGLGGTNTEFNEDSDGISIEDSTIEAAGTGSVTLTGDATHGYSSGGIDIENGATIRSVAGVVTLTGGGVEQRGVEIDASVIESQKTGVSTDTVIITGSGYSYGIRTDIGTQIRAVDGGIRLTGTASA